MLGNWGLQRGGEGAWRSKELMVRLGWPSHLPGTCTGELSLTGAQQAQPPTYTPQAWPSGPTQGRPPAAGPPLPPPSDRDSAAPRGGGLLTLTTGSEGIRAEMNPDGAPLLLCPSLSSLAPLSHLLSHFVSLSSFSASPIFLPSSLPCHPLCVCFCFPLSFFHISFPFSLPLISSLSPFSSSFFPTGCSGHISLPCSVSV